MLSVFTIQVLVLLSCGSAAVAGDCGTPALPPLGNYVVERQDQEQHAATAEQQPVSWPPLTGRVVDRAGLLSEAEERELEAALAAHERVTTDQVVVVTVESLQGLAIEEYGYGLGNHWGIGQEDRDNGVLLIVAPNERRVRIEVGSGLEDVLTNARSGSIIEAEIVPRFRAGDFPGGIRAGIAALLRALAER